METLAVATIIKKIQSRETFSAEATSGAFSISVDAYQPAVFTAIHDGHGIGHQLCDKLLISEAERIFEEDPCTFEIIETFPIVLRGLDSRFRYDLNRRPEEAIYEEAWGQKVWRKPLSPGERKESLQRHSSYYTVLHALLETLEEQYNRCVVYDLHSYNYRRIKGSPPLFNIGTHYIDWQQHRPFLEDLQKRLQQTIAPDIENRAVFDEVFYGKGYQAAFIHSRHPHSLCVPLEIKKIFMDESGGAPLPPVLARIKEHVRGALAGNAAYFAGENPVPDRQG